MSVTINLNLGWNFDNSYARLPDTLFTKQNPTPVKSPKLIKLNRELAASLSLNIQLLESEIGIAELAGNQLPEKAMPIAQAYAGHQFGHFTMLGDGRAILLGEQITPKGERFDIQLKGAGRTPYSRGGDGRAALGPMLREYIISEAMHSLGIETTRSLAVVTTGEPVYRETVLTGAVLTRVASSHIRVGTFQYISNLGNIEELRILADYTLQRHFPQSAKEDNPYLSLLQAVIRSQATLISKWQLIGFIHGVMNTDNMTLSGETIDYGPCAFMDTYDPETVFSSIDSQGRYAYGNQPHIAAWNLARLADSLLPLLNPDREKAIELAQGVLSDFPTIYRINWLDGMRKKLGLNTVEAEDEILIESLLKMMHSYHADYTNTFLALTFQSKKNIPLFDQVEFAEWYNKWKARLDRNSKSGAAAITLMKNSNPAVIPRNHRVEEALYAAINHGDYSVMERLLDALSKPFEHLTNQTNYAEPSNSSVCPYRTFCGT